ncbi:F390 synthetase-related protein [Pseudahrensia aquimaris]|uniref:F390 synthetase-related protein n=1 Tax=Pseudahrensia aquimaris TaxID=744461 RepID=A0ABW3FGS8_9HYPH
MSAVGLYHALGSYLRVRTFPLIHGSATSVEKWQTKRLSNWIKRHVSAVPAFGEAARDGSRLQQFPVMTKADLMADFAAYNSAGISAKQGWEAFAGPKQIGPYVVGASTGTSGNRGLFVISQQERFRWLGAILAKGVPDFWRHKDRVAVMLPLDTPLYDTANKTSRLQLQFFDTSNPLDSLIDGLEGFVPTILIAPPRVLRRMVEMGVAVSPRSVFSAAEKLEAFDRNIIEAGLKTRLREIYMASEGLLAVSCKHNRLHLCEDCMHFELEDVGDGLVSPIISDFSRTTQIMMRYRMNDLLRMDSAPCPCGSPLRVVSEVIGRVDDVFKLSDTSGNAVEITPDLIRNTIVDTDRTIRDFRVIQTAPERIELKLEQDCLSDIGERARARLVELFAKHGCEPSINLAFEQLTEPPRGKLRRVECRLEGRVSDSKSSSMASKI